MERKSAGGAYFEDIPVANDPPTMESDPMEGVEKIEIEDEPILLEDEEF